MCGIAFISLTKTSTIDSLGLTANLLTALEQRGTDASGFAWRDEGDGSWYVKSPNRGRTQAARLRKKGTMPATTRTVIVHTRYATLGDPAREVNNHPLIRPGVMLVHNGHIRDHHLATRTYKIKRTAEVDSEVLAFLAAKFTPVEACIAMSNLSGTAAVAWLSTGDRPGVLHAARIAGSPLVIGQTAEGDTIGASTEQLLRHACHASKIVLDWVHHVQPGTYLRLEDGIIADWHKFEVDFMPTTRPDYSRPSVYGRR